MQPTDLIDLGHGQSCTLTELDAALRRAYNHPTTEYDRLCILLAWEAGEVSEGNAAKLLRVDRETARERKQAAIANGVRMATRDVRTAIREGAADAS